MRKVKAFQIDIPVPCNEKWGNMIPTKGGRHCEHCEKTIVDFTDKTDREIAHLYMQHGDKLCGRFAPNQLRRDIILNPKSPSRHLSKAAATILAGMLSTGTVSAQGMVTLERTEQHVFEKENEKTRPPNTRTISGQIFDENGETLPFANVFIEGTSIGTTTDIDGNYTLEIPENAETLIVAFTGYIDKIIDLTGTGAKIDVIMTDGGILLGDICIVEVAPYGQDAPHGRTFPRLIRDWIENIKEKRQKKKRESRQVITSVSEESRVIKNETPDVHLPQIITKKLITNVLPNPFDDKIRVTLESEVVEMLRLVVYDSVSRVIHTEQAYVLEGINEIDVNLEGKQLGKGSYFLSIFRGNEIIQTEILIRVK